MLKEREQRLLEKPGTDAQGQSPIPALSPSPRAGPGLSPKRQDSDMVIRSRYLKVQEIQWLPLCAPNTKLKAWPRVGIWHVPNE